jgi:hypothetical protein
VTCRGFERLILREKHEGRPWRPGTPVALDR